ncbi:ATP-binding cassette domain-containing protein [Thermosynechococcus sp. PKX82]|uniref:ABC transporter ATP-binding protein n=1 Tax=Thermosynechococcus sp. PKX82 TaxID=3074086 RepID=UPI0028738474|nr:ATP-binding cassette domain-containing protein [Thermosynechococcus sp. PKX82]WNC29426.1 ATP-binding cassette domain-containing protein [Thermosynechococcus sp. PKX82]
MTATVKVEHLKKSYGTITAVADVSFSAHQGEIFGVLGPNGSGKTTTLRCLCTLSRPDAGVLEVCGLSVLHQPHLVRQKLGYVAQEVALDKILTGQEFLELQAALYHIPRALIPERIEAVLARLDLLEWHDRQCGTYSGGIRKRFDLAAGLLHQPQVLVLDEPTVGLDIESRQVIWDVLRDLKAQGLTIILTSHYLEEVDLLSDRLAILDKGRVIASGSPEELKANIGGDRVTLRVREFTPRQEAQMAQTLLSQLDCVKSALINANQGNSLNLVVTDAAVAIAAIRRALEEAGLPLFSVAQSRPSLDDVYLAATGQTLLDADLAAAAQRDSKQLKKEAMQR